MVKRRFVIPIVREPFKVIALTEEEKKAYELKANLSTHYRKKKRARCICHRKYTIAHAIRCGHPGACSSACAQGKVRIGPKISYKNTVKQERQVKRAERIKPRVQLDFYDTREWKDLRFKVLRKYGYRCLACGRTPKDHGIVIHVDHIKARSRYPELEFSFDNLQPLCADCNIGKSNKSEDDLRPKD